MATCCFKSDLAISSISICPKGPRSWCLRGILANLVGHQLISQTFKLGKLAPHTFPACSWTSKEERGWNKPDTLRPKARWASAPPSPWRRWSSGWPAWTTCTCGSRPGGRLSVSTRPRCGGCWSCWPGSRCCRWPRSRRRRSRMLGGLPRRTTVRGSRRRPRGEAVQHANARTGRRKKERKKKKNRKWAAQVYYIKKSERTRTTAKFLFLIHIKSVQRWYHSSTKYKVYEV